MQGRFRKFNRDELIGAISDLRIDRVGNEVITSYSGRTLRTKRVSDRYEVFDIATYMVRHIDRITSNFTVTHYSLRITGGTQYLILVSDPVEVGGRQFRKCFFILNSSDCSRSLSIRMGLCLDGGDLFVIPSVHNINVGRRHLRGITASAEDASSGVYGETFGEQVRAISSLVGERVMLGRVRQLLVGDGRGHGRFDALRSALLRGGSLTPAESAALSRMPPSDSAGDDLPHDMHLDAYLVFTTYMSIHSRCDSHVVARETDRIMRITSSFIRKSKIEQALSD